MDNKVNWERLTRKQAVQVYEVGGYAPLASHENIYRAIQLFGYGIVLEFAKTTHRLPDGWEGITRFIEAKSKGVD